MLVGQGDIDWRRVKQLREKGLSYRAIAKLLGVGYNNLLRRMKEELEVA